MNFKKRGNHVKAVLFDLDDTLFDYKFSRREGLAALQEEFPQLREISIEELEKEHERLLSADYARVLDGKVAAVDATTERIRKLCEMHGVKLNPEEAMVVADTYVRAYMKNRQPVPGSRELLTELRDKTKVGLVTNGLVEPQVEKLRVCQVAEPLDFIVISEAVGHKKPEKEIFEIALKQAKVKPSEAVYVGDSWSSDVLPAVSVGMKAVWLNRYNQECPEPQIAREVNSLVGVDPSVFLQW